MTDDMATATSRLPGELRVLAVRLEALGMNARPLWDAAKLAAEHAKEIAELTDDRDGLIRDKWRYATWIRELEVELAKAQAAPAEQNAGLSAEWEADPTGPNPDIERAKTYASFSGWQGIMVHGCTLAAMAQDVLDLQAALDAERERRRQAEQQAEALAEALEDEWQYAHADACTNVENWCASVGGSRPCHHPRPKALAGYRAGRDEAKP